MSASRERVSESLSFKSGYMNRVYDVRDIASTFRLLKKHHPDKLRFDTLVGTGLSGSIVVPQLARMLRKKWLVIRKNNDQTHSPYAGEGEIGKRWLFVDDLISSGKTRSHCVDKVHELLDYRATRRDWTTLVGTFLYDSAALETNVVNLSEWRRDYRIVATVTTRESAVAGNECYSCFRFEYRCTCEEFTPYPKPSKVVLEPYQDPNKVYDPWGVEIGRRPGTSNPFQIIDESPTFAQMLEGVESARADLNKMFAASIVGSSEK